MGFCLARKAREMGAFVTLIAGRHKGDVPAGIETVNITSTRQMYDEVTSRCKDFDVIIKAAAPADYRVENYSPKKHKEERLNLTFVKNPDIAKAVGEIKGEAKLVIFAAETENLIENAKAKLKSKNADLVVANDVTQEGAGFDVNTNIVTLIDKQGNASSLPQMSKEEVALAVMEKIAEIMQ
jgi:phosphopantothenoylcysteine decarboxylase/phosphopantothenate--cysteine ligase